MLHRKLRTPKHFHGLSPLELCLSTNTGSFTQGGIYPYFLLPDTSFLLSFHVIVGLCWTSSNGIEPTQSITKRSVDYNHALTPIQCDVPVHMQCNAPLHVISFHMYNECYMDNTFHTTHQVSWTITSFAYDFHTIFIHVNILCTHISTSTYNMSLYIQAVTHTQSSHVMAICTYKLITCQYIRRHILTSKHVTP